MSSAKKLWLIALRMDSEDNKDKNDLIKVLKKILKKADLKVIRDSGRAALPQAIVRATDAQIKKLVYHQDDILVVSLQ